MGEVITVDGKVIDNDRDFRRVLKYVEIKGDDPSAYEDGLAVLYGHIQAGEREYHDYNKQFRGRITAAMRRMAGGEWPKLERMNEVYKKSLLMDAQVDFDSFMLYLESNRKPEERFYLPRRKVLRPIVEAFQEVHDGKLDLLTVSQPKRTGKALPIDTDVLTPTGFQKIGQIKVGDKVIAANGNATEVIGVFPQGKKQVYKVTFGETGKCQCMTTVECCEDHLWTIRTEEDRANGNSRVMSTKDIMNGTMYRGSDKHRNYSVDYLKPAQFEQFGEMLIKPYLMGVLIAEGGLTSGLRFSTSDEEVLMRVKQAMPDGDTVVFVDKYDYQIKSRNRKTNEKGHMVKCNTGNALVKYGLWGKYAYEKFIPKEYLYTSVENRIELLQALFDCDGSVANNGAEYSTTSKRLADDVAFLVRGLGGRCRIVKRMGSYTIDGERKETRDNYRVMCKFQEEIVPFALERKLKNYNPKMKRLRHFIENIVPTDEYKEMVCISVADESKQYVVGENMIPTHNTTLGTWFVLFRAGNAPNGSSICVGSGDLLVKSFYNGMLEVLTARDKYLYFDVFPNAQLKSTNADEKTINLRDKKRFATVTCRPIDGQITGSTEATPDGLLYLDDCVKNEEEAINRERLDLLWDKIRGDILGRRLEGCPIVAQGTRYSLYDPLGRLQEVAPTMGWRTKVLEIPALDPVTDESNFEITIKGQKMFTTEYYRHERELVTEMQWESQFGQHPFEAKGRLFPEGELNRYFSLPVDKDPDTIIAVCDTAERGSDSVMMPIAYIYGEDVFIEDCVFSNATPEHTKPECANMLIKHKVVSCTFESNNAGEYFARDVEELIKKQGGRISIKTKRTISNKTTRIENASSNILKHFYFKDKSLYNPNSEYGLMIKELVSYTRNGKVKHDDSPDGLSLLENELRFLGSGKVEVMLRPF